MNEGRFKHRPDKMIFDKLVGMKQSPSLIACLNGCAEWPRVEIARNVPRRHAGRLIKRAEAALAIRRRVGSFPEAFTSAVSPAAFFAGARFDEDRGGNESARPRAKSPAREQHRGEPWSSS